MCSTKKLLYLTINRELDHKLNSIYKETTFIPPLASTRIQRWALLLGGYDYTIAYKPGNEHANADMLSRFPSTSAPSDPLVPLETLSLSLTHTHTHTHTHSEQYY